MACMIARIVRAR